MKAPEHLVEIGCEALPRCGEPARRERLREAGRLNGIDFVEVDDRGDTLCVHLFGDVPDDIGIESVRIRGGHRITDLRVIGVRVEREAEFHDDACLRVELDRPGDHTPYCLCLVDAATSGPDPASWRPYPGFDPRYACAEVRFRLDCPQTLDCATETPCAEPPRPAPEINYLARDYASFRQLFFDRMALTMPDWRERHVPDVGVALVEALAYTADHLSYYQDAVATEAYLGTARRRISVRRHARLVDYRLHEGCNARALVTLASDTDLELSLENLLLLVPPPGEEDPKPGPIGASQLERARERGAVMFEPMPRNDRSPLRVVAAQSAIRFHTWGDELCCLPRGSTRATLVDARRPDAPPTASPDAPVPSDTPPSTGPNEPGPIAPRETSPHARAATFESATRVLGLKRGDILVFEEVLGPGTGNPADADPSHRHAVRLTAVEPAIDPLDGTPVLEIAWDHCDALPFDLCLSVRKSAPDCTWLHDVSLARGNVLLVDHGEHVQGSCTCEPICSPTGSDGDYPGLTKALEAVPDACVRCGSLAEHCWLVPGSFERDCCRCEGAVQDVTRSPASTSHTLPGSPLTWAEPVPADAPVCKLFERDPRRALPQVTVYGGPLGEVLVPDVPAARWRWESRDDLLESGADDRHFVVEIDDEGAAQLRFGDGTLGRRPDAGDFFRARPRIGNGPAGNVGRDSIVWLALKSGSLSGADLRPRNPLAASGGQAPESIAEAKLYAPGAFRARPLRAIVASDYAAFAAREPELQGATCCMEWTGSWYEANVVADPLESEALPESLAARIAAGLERYRRIGHDVAVEGACYVPLLIEIHLCVLPEFLAAHVEAELLDRFSSSRRRDGSPGFFHPDRLKLGAPVYESALLAEAQSVTGVACVEVITLARLEGGRHGDLPADHVLKLASREIAQVDNDPDYPDHGSITFIPGGGR